MKKRNRCTQIIVLFTIVSVLCIFALQPLGAAELISKKYELKRDTWLEVGTSVKDILLKSIRFNVPGKMEGKHIIISESVKANVIVENKSAKDQKVGIAIALFDSEGNLVGVGSGGSKMFFKARAGQESEYVITFSYVTDMIDEASTFQITLELR